ncbi:unnamed protein product [Prorocentrum cordatum]|uniref:Uncharacterized protein n=1 Tax=Prorocentrum cordatum TaxID=2364126 RepID=A0ABN9T0M5_9DINO|nr:unnamed protein product [Polarella glacialis]
MRSELPDGQVGCAALSPLVLERTDDRLRGLGPRSVDIAATLAGVPRESLAADHWQAVRHRFHGAVRAHLRRQDTLAMDMRLRRMLQLVRCSLPRRSPRVVACRFVNRVQTLRNLVPPGVRAVVLRTAWNWWCTARRVQKIDVPRNVCILGCGGAPQDSVEH